MAPRAPLGHVPPRNLAPPEHSEGLQARACLQEAGGMGTYVAPAASAADEASEEKDVVIVPRSGGRCRRARWESTAYSARLRGRAWAVCLMVVAFSGVWGVNRAYSFVCVEVRWYFG